MEDYINQKSDRKLSGWSISSCSSDWGEALENWQNQLHEVSMQKCARIKKYVRWVGIAICDPPIYEGLPTLGSFATEFEEKYMTVHTC